MPVTIVQLLLGIAILFAGNALLVRGARSAGIALKIPTAILALSVGAYGPGIPALLLGMQAAATGSPDLAIGLVAGSALFSLLLVPGILTLRAPLATGGAARADARVLAGAAALLFCFAYDGEIGRSEGLAMAATMAAYILHTWRSSESRAAAPGKEDANTKNCAWCAAAYMLIGLGLLFTGADIAIDAAAGLAHTLHRAESTVGLAMLAPLTGLPLLLTLLAAKAQQPLSVSISISIFNILAITGAASILVPIPVAPWLGLATIPAASLLILLLTARGKPLGRCVGAVLVALFTGYVVYQYLPIA